MQSWKLIFKIFFIFSRLNLKTILVLSFQIKQIDSIDWRNKFVSEIKCKI